MDMSVKPGDDFYTYASGNWIKNNPVPAKETRWGSFNVLRDFNIEAVRGLLDDAAANKNAPAGSVERRVSDFYKAAMDSVAIDKLGYTPIKADLKKLSAINSKQAAIEQIAKARTLGMGSPFYGFYIGQDRKSGGSHDTAVFAGRHYPTRPRLLPERRRPQPENPGGLPRLYREAFYAHRYPRSAGQDQRRRDHEAGNRTGAGTDGARGDARSAEDLQQIVGSGFLQKYPPFRLAEDHAHDDGEGRGYGAGE